MLPTDCPPMHPGESLAEDFLAELNMAPEELAAQAEIPIGHIEALLAEQEDFSISDAVRIAQALGTTPDFWINLQVRYDQWLMENGVNAVAN